MFWLSARSSSAKISAHTLRLRQTYWRNQIGYTGQQSSLGGRPDQKSYLSLQRRSKAIICQSIPVVRTDKTIRWIQVCPYRPEMKNSPCQAWQSLIKLTGSRQSLSKGDKPAAKDSKASPPYSQAIQSVWSSPVVALSVFSMLKELVWRILEYQGSSDAWPDSNGLTQERIFF